jgi:small subunit ribosomal protein S3
MGKKVNPRAFRQASNYRTASKWYASPTQFAHNLQIDVELRKFLKKKFRDGGISRIEIERSSGQITVIVYTSKPGVIIGRGGALIDETKKEVKQKFFGSVKMKVNMSIQEIRQPDTDPELIVQAIRDQLEARIPFRRAIKRGLEQVMRAGAKGCKIQVAGRLNGADIARTEFVTQGRLPLTSLRARVRYSRGVANTVYGVIGIKVWIYTGDVFGEEEEKEQPRRKRPARRPRAKRKRLKTDGDKMTLRKKVDVEKEKTTDKAE